MTGTPNPLTLAGATFGFGGDSLTSGILVPAGQYNWVKPAEGSSLAAGLLDTHFSPTINNYGQSGTTIAQIITRIGAAWTANDKARRNHFWPLQNDVTNLTANPDLPTYATTGYNSILAAVTGPTTFWGITARDLRISETWSRRNLTNRALQAAFPTQFVDINYPLLNGGTGLLADQSRYLLDQWPESIGENKNTQHFGGGIVGGPYGGGTYILYREFFRWQAAILAYAPYVSPNTDLRIAGDPGNGGTIGQVYAWGSNLTWSIVDASNNFAIGAATTYGTNNAKSVSIIRANGTALTAAYYDVTVQARNSFGVHRGHVRIYVGAASTASPVMANFNNAIAYSRTTRTASWATVQKLSIAILLKNSSAVSSKRILEFTGNNAAQVGGVMQLNSAGGTVRMFGRNTANTVTADGTSVGTIANGQTKWAFVSLDLVAGTGSITIDDGTTATTTAFGTATGSGSIDISSCMFMFCDSTAPTTSTALPNPFVGGIQELWVSIGSYIDFSVSGNRDLFRVGSGSVAPVDLGASGVVSAITPDIYMVGNLSDWAYGLNRGALGNFAAWLTNDGSGTIT